MQGRSGLIKLEFLNTADAIVLIGSITIIKEKFALRFKSFHRTAGYIYWVIILLLVSIFVYIIQAFTLNNITLLMTISTMYFLCNIDHHPFLLKWSHND